MRILAREMGVIISTKKLALKQNILYQSYESGKDQILTEKNRENRLTEEISCNITSLNMVSVQILSG